MRVDRALKVAIGVGAIASAVLFGVDYMHGPHFTGAPTHPVEATGEVVPLICNEHTFYLTAHAAAVHHAAFVAGNFAIVVTSLLVVAAVVRWRRARTRAQG